MFTLSAPNRTDDVSLNSPKTVGRIFLFILEHIECVISSYILTRKPHISCCYCKEKIDVNKLAGAERVN